MATAIEYGLTASLLSVIVLMGGNVLLDDFNTENTKNQPTREDKIISQLTSVNPAAGKCVRMFYDAALKENNLVSSYWLLEGAQIKCLEQATEFKRSPQPR
ncbi:MAG: hypothetical protein COB76_05210 [Alphaproteobacteria bacterium]|nr:MAG: hypothetical protein COB76_05210 [Alphaproteobacteria bacterium]